MARGSRIWLAVATLCLSVVPSQAQFNPQRHITVVVPIGAGGGGDATGRLFAEQRTERLKQPVVVDDMIILNRNLGLEAILQIAEERAPGGFRHIHDVLSQEELETTAISFKKAAGFDVETVNSRESLVEIAAG